MDVVRPTTAGPDLRNVLYACGCLDATASLLVGPERMFNRNYKLVQCWNPNSERPTTWPLAPRLHRLIAEGWSCRLAHFDRGHAIVVLQERKTENP
jgi:hypothetical protein